MPNLNAIGIVSADLGRTRSFYALLGVEIAEGDDHVEATLASGLRLMARAAIKACLIDSS